MDIGGQNGEGNVTNTDDQPRALESSIKHSQVEGNNDAPNDPISNENADNANNNFNINVSSSSNISISNNNIHTNNVEDEVVYEGKVLTKQNRPTSLTLYNKHISWTEKGTPAGSMGMNNLIGVTTIDKFFTLHAIVDGKKHKIKETVTFKCENAENSKQWADSIHEVMNKDGQGSRGCRVVFVVNPFSGTKKALSVLSSVRHLFDIAGMHVTVIETDRAGHAREIGRSIEISTVDRLICVSGDGLFNELINGLMDRSDWADAIKIPLGVIPAGSGNGLAYTLGNASPIDAALAIIKGFIRPFDIIRTLQNGRPLYGFLTLTWAMISDVDIESEKMRWMGALRFSIGALKRIISLRKYRGKISFLPADIPQPHAQCISYKHCTHCKSENPILAQPQELGQQNLISCLYDPSQPTPPTWQVLEDEFVVFIATNVPWISTDFMASPHAHLSDGSIDLVLVRAKPELTKAKLLSLMLQTDDGKYIHSPLVEHYKVKALYLEPGNLVSEKNESIGIIAVDGEKVSYTPVGMEIFRGLVNILCLE